MDEEKGLDAPTPPHPTHITNPCEVNVPSPLSTQECQQADSRGAARPLHHHQLCPAQEEQQQQQEEEQPLARDGDEARAPRLPLLRVRRRQTNQ